MLSRYNLQSRGFSTTSLCLREALKVRLRKALSEEEVEEPPKIDRQQRKRLQKAKIERYQAAKETEKTLKETLDKYFSNVRNVLEKPDFNPRHPAVYRYLGTTKQQLLNPFLVSEEVSKYLKKGQPAKAAFIVKLAGGTGSVGMNLVLKHLISEKRQKLAVKLYNAMKKWGTRENEHTNTSLAPEKQKNNNTIKVEGIVRAYEKAAERIPSHDKAARLVNLNTALRALAAKRALDDMVSLFEEASLKDGVTYSTMLSAIALAKDPEEYSELVDEVWHQAQDAIAKDYFKMDRVLAVSYFHAKCKMASDQDISEVIREFGRYFAIPDLDNSADNSAISRDDPAKSQGNSANSKSDLDKSKNRPKTNSGAEKLFDFGAPELDIFLKLLVRARRYSEAMRYFDHFRSFQPEGIDMPHYRRYIDCIQETGDLERMGRLVDVFKADADKRKELDRVLKLASTPEEQKAAIEKQLDQLLHPPSDILASLMGTYLRCDADKISPEQVEAIKKIAQKNWGKRPHIDILSMYARVYHRLISEASESHPRNGVVALNDIALSHQVLALHLSKHSQVEECVATLQHTADLADAVYNHKAWKKHKFVWIKKMGEMCMALRNAVDTPNQRTALEEFVLDMQGVVRRAK
ncbi:hypothetical protein TRVA0_001S00518 [Trichomonascus vanleenenianus]|uniref:Mrx1p n=1 Tax=Trichomonascus vanleenenianus TaxID=2268995 RepID=UPI003ECB8706